MIRKLTIYCAMLLSVAAMLSGCAVHQWPEPKDSMRRAKIRLEFNPDFRVWEYLYDPKQSDYPMAVLPEEDFDPEHPGTTSAYDNTVPSGLMDVRLKFYNDGNMSNCVAEYSFTHDVSGGYDCEVEVELPDGSYEVLVWSHLLEEAESAPFYDVSDMRGISIIDDNYVGSTDYRDGFRGRASLLVFETEQQGDEEEVVECGCVVALHRPMGKFEFVTTDLAEFLDRETTRRNLPTRASVEDYDVVISYPYYYPNGYNAVSDDIASNSGYRFTTHMTLTGESEASMGFDYVFINDIPDGHVQAQVSVYDLRGEQLSSSSTIMIPIRRDYHTVLRGAFLTMSTNGGIGIDPDYDGDYNIFPK